MSKVKALSNRYIRMINQPNQINESEKAGDESFQINIFNLFRREFDKINKTEYIVLYFYFEKKKTSGLSLTKYSLCFFPRRNNNYV
jgi:tRNA (Thr-GGU) A37 N-methylase